jgi:uncharacterized protein YecE (DUF72 family)
VRGHAARPPRLDPAGARCDLARSGRGPDAWPHSGKWDSKDIHERFGYRYTGAELAEWAPKVAALAADAGQTHVLFNNCYRDYAQVNAQQLTALLQS